jgi:hypothetical protein
MPARVNVAALPEQRIAIGYLETDFQGQFSSVQTSGFLDSVVVLERRNFPGLPVIRAESQINRSTGRGILHATRLRSSSRPRAGKQKV